MWSRFILLRPVILPAMATLMPPETWEDWLQIGAFFTRKKGEKLAGNVLDRDFYGSAEFAKRGFSFAWFVDR